MSSASGIHPDRLKELAMEARVQFVAVGVEAGIPIVDHEIVTLLRSFGAWSARGRYGVRGSYGL